MPFSETHDPLFGMLDLAMLDQSYNAVVITTPLLDGDHPKILYVNNAFTKMSGYTKEEIIGKTPRILQGDKTDKVLLAQLKETLLRREHFEGETVNYRKDGAEYIVHWNISPIYDHDGTLIAFLSFQKDVTLETVLLQQLRMFQSAIEQNGDPIALFDAEGRYVYANSAYSERTGHCINNLFGKKANILYSGEHSDAFYAKLWETVQSGEPYSDLFVNKNNEGEIYYEKQTITPIKEGDGVSGYIVIGKSYDRDYVMTEHLKSESMTDFLTSLPNRKALEKSLERAAYLYHREGRKFAILMLDLDNFKQINDMQGHDEGDRALIEVSALFRDTLRTSDALFRYGGDEFVILLDHADKKAAKNIAEKLTKALDGSSFKRYQLGVSIGIADYCGEPVQDFLKIADKAMYFQKEVHHKNTI
jgi:diguanylate cyclase (GGDEF)-like protein/PAS domain S-box-containing protein